MHRHTTPSTLPSLHPPPATTNLHIHPDYSALEREDGTYAPAYSLADSRLERAGRAARLATHSSTSEHARHGTAALLVIGDEVCCWVLVLLW